MITVALIVGALHVLAPDHWVPLSLFSWQKGWGVRKTRNAGLQLFGSHLLFGFVLALVLAKGSTGMDHHQLMILSLTLVSAVTLIRVFRFSRLKEAFSSGPHSKRGILAAWSLLGPAESLIPIVLRSEELGFGYFGAFLAYSCGTLLAGLSLVFWGRSVWNRPWILPRSWLFLQRSAPVIPAIALLITGISVWVQMPH